MEIIITLAFLAAALIAVFIGLAPWRNVARYESPQPDAPTDVDSGDDFDAAPGRRPDTTCDSPADAGLPKVSVVAFVLRDEENLTPYVDMLLGQNYPDYEVILVCDASAEATAMLSEKFEDTPNLKLTFIPPGSHNLSRRKLAQTLGIKRAEGEVVVTTSTSVMPRSEEWLRALVGQMADPEVDVVCGYVHPEFDDYRGMWKWYRQFDATLTAAQWMDAAIKGNPYRGDGYNLAFRRRLFFEAKGYSSTLTLMDGDDDIFIHEICAPGHGRLALSPDSTVDTRWGEDANRIHNDLKDRYRFTRRWLPKLPFLRAGMLSAIQWLMLIQFLAALTGIAMLIVHLLPGVFGEASAAITRMLTATFPPVGNELTAFTDTISMRLLSLIICNLLIPICTWGAEILTYRALARRLGSIRLFIAVVPFMLLRPLRNFMFALRHYPTRKSHFTWVRS
ncbi:MAG: glycosyltransferase [Muribaculaceae bacterium]|nr:glycosyltransferase [Muribaculaceae bacterium]